MELYKKYRPSELDEIIGNRSAVESLRQMIKKDSIPHTLLFSGPSGNGKTTLARILANKMNAEVTEMNMSHKEMRGIDGANELISKLGFKSLSGQKKVIILDEVDQATKDWQKAMKKPLEDTPNHVYFFLCTTMPEKLIKDIHTRSTQIQVHSINSRELSVYLKSIVEKENKSVNRSILRKITESSNGSVRKALVLLGQILEVSEDKQEELLKTIHIEDNEEVINLCRSLLRGERWQTISNILKGLKEDPESVRFAILGYMNSVLLNNGDVRACEIIMRFEQPFYNKALLTCACFELS